MDLDEAIYGRRSTREYTSDAVDEPTIRRLIDAAIHAPSASNEQPWTFTVVRDQALLDQISQAAKAHYLATMTTGPQYERHRVMLGDPQYHVFHHAPVLVVISGMRPGPWIAEDCALAAENLMLAACGVRPRHLLDRLLAGLPEHGGGEAVARHPGDVGARSADHRGPSEDDARAGRAKGAGGPLGRLIAPMIKKNPPGRGAVPPARTHPFGSPAAFQ